MAFFGQNLDSSDDEDEDHLFRHSERNFEALLAEQQRKRLERSATKEKPKPLSRDEVVATGRSNGKRKSDQHDQCNEASQSKRQKSASRSDTPSRKLSIDWNFDNSPTQRSPVMGIRMSTAEQRSERAQKRSAKAVVADLERDTQRSQPTKPPPEIVDEESDDEFAAIAREASRAQRRKHSAELKAAQYRSAAGSSSVLHANSHDRVADWVSATPHPLFERMDPIPSTDEPVVELYLQSYLPNTKPLRVKVRLSQPLGIVRQTWCRKQGFTDDQTKQIFLVSRLRRIYDQSTCRSLGLNADGDGQLVQEGAVLNPRTGLVHLQLADDEILQKLKDGSLAENCPPREQTEDLTSGQAVQGPPSEPVNGSEHISLVLRANGKTDFKLKTRPGTSIGKIIKAYKKVHNISDRQDISLAFDGDTLPPETFVRDTELTDLDIVEVHFG